MHSLLLYHCIPDSFICERDGFVVFKKKKREKITLRGHLPTYSFVLVACVVSFEMLRGHLPAPFFILFVRLVSCRVFIHLVIVLSSLVVSSFLRSTTSFFCCYCCGGSSFVVELCQVESLAGSPSQEMAAAFNKLREVYRASLERDVNLDDVRGSDKRATKLDVGEGGMRRWGLVGHVDVIIVVILQVVVKECAHTSLFLAHTQVVSFCGTRSGVCRCSQRVLCLPFVRA